MSRFAKTAFILAAVLSISACANTIRGLGQDTANTVNATQAAGAKVVNAAE
ncbi:MAG: entericidin [Oricola sp.]